MNSTDACVRRKPQLNARTRLLYLALATIAAACTDAGHPTATEEGTNCPEANVVLCTASTETRAAAEAALADIGLRSAPALHDGSMRSELTSRAADLVEALQAGQVERAQAVLADLRARTQGAPAQPAHPGDAPDLTAIQLALLQSARLLEALPSSQ